MRNAQHNAGLQPGLLYVLHAHIGMCKQKLPVTTLSPCAVSMCLKYTPAGVV